jgi:signal transduction histidine kinase
MQLRLNNYSYFIPLNFILITALLHKFSIRQLFFVAIKLCLFLLCCMPQVYAQANHDKYVIDSLEKFLAMAEADSEKILLYNDLAFRLRNDQLEKAEKYALTALALANKEEIKDAQARSYELLGLLKFRKGFYDLAIENHFQALRLREETENKQGMAWANNNIANVYLEQGNFENSLVYYHKALALQTAIKDSMGMGNSYKNMGWLFVRRKEPKNAFIALKQALVIATQIKDKRVISHIYNYLGDSYSQIAKYDSAIYFFEKALQIHQESKNGYDQTHTLNSIANSYLLQKKIDKALLYNNLALNLATKLGIRYEKQNAYLGLSDIYQQQNDYVAALHYYRQYASIKDSILSQSSANKIAHLQAEFDLEKKQEHILLLQTEAALKDEKIKEKNILISSAIVVVVLILFLVIILLYAIKQRQKNNQLLSLKNQELNSKNHEINQQKEELIATNETLTTTLQQLALHEQELMERNEEILVQQEELSTQNEALIEMNQQISQQKKEIELLNTNLETKIAERTQELQTALDTLLSQHTDLEQFAYIVSHNLKAPVAHILGLTSLLPLDTTNSTTHNEAHEINLRVREAAQNLAIILSDLNKILDVKNTTTKKHEKVILNDIITQVLTQIQLHSTPTQTEIQTDFTPNSSFMAIPAYIENIVFQLLSNAIKFRDNNRVLEINIKTFVTDTHLVLAIKDNGLGMYDTANLFRLYHKQHEQLSGKAFGLFMVKIQVEVLGGQIEVQTCIGEGTMFKVYFKKD